MCITHGFMDGLGCVQSSPQVKFHSNGLLLLGNNGITNPIISSCLEISNGIPPLLPPGDHTQVQNSWHLLECKLIKTIPTL